MEKIRPWFLIVFGLCAMGVWGCSQQKNNPVNTKIRELETRYSKLEEDFRTLQASNEQSSKRLSQLEAQTTALETEKSDLTAQLDTIVKERDALRTQISQRTQERDSAQANLTQFSKDLQALAGRVEAALNTTTPPAATIVPASRRNE